MKNVLAFGASNSTTSINAKLARYAATRLSNVNINFIDLNDFEMPIFSIDREKATGIPKEAYRFKEQIRSAEGILISFAEHNGSYSVAFKNIMDWASRIPGGLWLEKPLCFLATSTGRGGAKSVLEAATKRAPRMDGRVVSQFSLPSFNHTFDAEKGITEPDLAQQLQTALSIFQEHLNTP
ncbi:MAG: NAD(P)H-dependent oxidoreductase [Myxococcota bacterium]|nr:NAD(P)H-dependent oxidoreductase [Myxococcota bacterium]